MISLNSIDSDLKGNETIFTDADLGLLQHPRRSAL